MRLQERPTDQHAARGCRGGCRILARGGGILHELLMKGRGARENFCGAHSNFSTDFIGH